MRRHIVESHLISIHHHPVRTATGSSALRMSTGSGRVDEQFAHSFSVAVSVDAGSAII